MLIKMVYIIIKLGAKLRELISTMNVQGKGIIKLGRLLHIKVF